MKLVYAYQTRANFGDALNEVLWERLIPGLLDDDPREGFLGIGTLVGFPVERDSTVHVFSSGAGYDGVTAWQGSRRVWCVRGPLTAHLLGLEPGVALTDGALLAPAVLEVARAPMNAAGSISVVPHWQSLRYSGWDRACDDAGLRLISPLDTPERVHAAIAGSRLVLAEALHAAICADSLGVPWIPFVSTANISLFKWVDWCASVGVAFAPMVLPPPSADAVLAFGRPNLGRWGARRNIDAETALAELHGRTRHAARGRGAAPGTLRPVLRRVLAEASGRYTPARTAEALRAAALGPVTLSHEGERERLRTQLLERLHALAASVRP
jgi:succinoglycan biosynthesis protein ExoV